MTRLKALAVAVLTTLVFGSVAVGITANSTEGGSTEATLPATAQESGLSPDAAPSPTEQAPQGTQIAAGDDDREDHDGDERDEVDDHDEDEDDDRHEGDRDD